MIVRDRIELGCFQKEIRLFVRAPLFPVLVWSRHLFLYKKIRKNKYELHDQNISNVID